MATNDTEHSRNEPNEPQPALPAASPVPAIPEPAVPPAQTAIVPATAPAIEPDPTGRLRAEFAEIAAVAAQAARLGVAVDAADAVARGVSADALRRSVLDTLSQRSEATSVIVTAPSTPAAGDSPIVRRARERAAAARA